MQLPARSVAPLLATALTLVPAAEAQDFSDTQVLTSRLLLTKQEQDRRQRAAERAQVEDLARRATAQAVLLEAQAGAVAQLGTELRAQRDERLLLEVAATFDAAIASGRLEQLQALVADPVLLETREGGVPGEAVPAADLVARLRALTAGSRPLPRFNQRVRLEDARATLISDGYAWRRPDQSSDALARYRGEFEYRFELDSGAWKINAIIFRPLAL